MATTPGTELIELETGVYARLHDGLTNAGFIVGDRGVLVIDSLRVPSFAVTSSTIFATSRVNRSNTSSIRIRTLTMRGATRSFPKQRLSDMTTAIKR